MIHQQWKSRQMWFRGKTAYVWGLRYRWDPSLSRNLIPRFPHYPALFNLKGLVYLGDVPALPLPVVVQVHHVQVRTGRGAPRWLPFKTFETFEKCNMPNVTANTTYLAVLPPVLNILPVSCTLEAQSERSELGAFLFQTKGSKWLLLCVWEWLL